MCSKTYKFSAIDTASENILSENTAFLLFFFC